MLAARERGLHTCPQAAWLPYHELARRHCGMDATWTLVCGMALGHLDPTEHANAFRTPRLPVSDFLTASGFQETT
jgi:nitroreductase